MKSGIAKRTTKSLQRLRYKGELIVDGEKFPIGFYASAGMDCRLVIDLDKLSSGVYLKILRNDSKPGQKVRTVGVCGRSRNGYTLKSDRLSVTAHGYGTDGFHISVKVQTAEISAPLKEAQPVPVLRFLLRSFESFRNPPFETPLGTLTVTGATKVQDVDAVSGVLTLIAQSDKIPDDWFETADAFLDHMCQGLSFAHGGRLQIPRVDLVRENTWTSIYYSGDGSRSEFPIQHSLHQEPIIRALVDRYFEKGAMPEHLWTALGWMQMETTYDEVRFLTGMTALESVLEYVLPARKGTTISKSAFALLKSGLMEVIQNQDGFDDAREIFTRQIAGMNRKTLAQKIDALFKHLGISRRDLEKPVIAAMIKLRNDIVHRGTFPPGTDKWQNIILVREMIVRIILTELGFKGRYQCYIGGGHDRDFPDV